MPLLIAVPRPNLQGFRNELFRIAGFDWESRREIFLFPLDGKCKRQVIPPGLVEFCQNHQIDEIWVPDRVHCGEPLLRKAEYTVTPVATIATLLQGGGIDALKRRLRSRGLDWRNRVLSRLSGWLHGTVTEQHLDLWLSQFDDLGDYRFVGEQLAQMLDMVSGPELSNALFSGAEMYGDRLIIGLSAEGGSSGEFIGQLAKHRCGLAQRLSVEAAIIAAKPPKVLWLVEDCLLSGIEVRDMMDRLRGDASASESGNAAPGKLTRVPTEMRFGVVCDFGMNMVQHYMAAHSLPNFQVSVGNAVRKILVLAKESVPSPDDATIAAEIVDLLRSRVTPFAFQEGRGWKDSGTLSQAVAFCQSVGEQLWRSRLERLQKKWPDEIVRRCALGGKESLGLTIAFPYSVPKGTLPLFWIGGRVNLNGATIQWQPLIPAADDSEP